MTRTTTKHWAALAGITALMGIGVGASVIGCQTYDFQPVKPAAIAHQTISQSVAAKGYHPKIMMLVDRSQSMNIVDSGSTTSRLAQLKSAMGTFLTDGDSSSVAQFGFVGYSSLNGQQCDAPKLADITSVGVDLIDSDDDGPLVAQSSKVNTAIQGLTALGGTPTAASLTMLQTYEKLVSVDSVGRKRFVILLTDGLPNCNLRNANNQCNAVNATCKCTSVIAGACTHPSDCSAGCLDEDASVTAARALFAQGVQVIVVGFGAELNTDEGYDVLNKIAVAGGFSPTCDAKKTCSAGTDPADVCIINAGQSAGVCTKKYYQANTGPELAKALKLIIGDIVNPCHVVLTNKVKDLTLLSVKVDNQIIPSGPDTWVYSEPDGNPVIDFKAGNPTCDKLQASTKLKPIALEINAVNIL